MSSFRKALKSKQRDHKERSQPGSRKHLGLLEKKKDYKLRADDYHRKQKTLNALRKKAQDKNPDEFYYKMINTQLKDGEHVIKQKNEELTEEQKKIMRTQDIGYVEMKRVAESKKIERLKSELHLLDAEGKQKNTHVFLWTPKNKVKLKPGKVNDFNLATHLNTMPELVNRTYNRPTLDTLVKKSIVGAVTPKNIAKLAQQRKVRYNELSERIDREKKMFIISQKIQTRKDLQDKNKKVKVKNETTTAPAIYKFAAKRKR